MEKTICPTTLPPRKRVPPRNDSEVFTVLDRNFVDADFRVELPMPCFSTGIFPPTEFLDHEFRPLDNPENLCLDRCPGEGGTANLDSRIPTYAKYLIESKAISGMALPIVDRDLLPFLDFELFSTISNDGIHRKFPTLAYNGQKAPVIGNRSFYPPHPVPSMSGRPGSPYCGLTGTWRGPP